MMIEESFLKEPKYIWNTGLNEASQAPDEEQFTDKITPQSGSQLMVEELGNLRRFNKTLLDSETGTRRWNVLVALRPILLVAQCLGVMPIYGIFKPSANQLKFKWVSLRVAYSVWVAFTVTFLIICTIIWAAFQRVTMSVVEPIIWFITKLLSLVFFMSLARQWSGLMIQWQNVEAKIPLYSDSNRNSHCARKLKIITFFMLLGFVVEHTMNIAASWSRVVVCTHQGTFEAYMLHTWPQLYFIWDYTAIIGVIGEIVNYYCAFLWIFKDGFLICISICLSTLLSQLNEHLEQFKGMAMSIAFWEKQRERFLLIKHLIKNIDFAHSKIVILSLITNLYYVLVQLLHAFEMRESKLEYAYFWMSLVLLLVRSFFVVFTAANINEESKKPTDIIREMPSKSYNIEANRLLEEITNTPIGLSGLKYFYITRSLMLSVAGTIITYEVVLVQFQLISTDDKTRWETMCSKLF